MCSNLDKGCRYMPYMVWKVNPAVDYSRYGFPVRISDSGRNYSDSVNLAGIPILTHVRINGQNPENSESTPSDFWASNTSSHLCTTVSIYY